MTRPRVLFDCLEFQVTLPPCHKITIRWGSDEPALSSNGVHNASGLIDDSGDEDHPWFVMYEEDSYWPSLFLVRAEHFSDAYEAFQEHRKYWDMDGEDQVLFDECARGYEAKLMKGWNK